MGQHIVVKSQIEILTEQSVAIYMCYKAAAEEVVDMRGGSAELTQTYFYSLVR